MYTTKYKLYRKPHFVHDQLKYQISYMKYSEERFLTPDEYELRYTMNLNAINPLLYKDYKHEYWKEKIKHAKELEIQDSLDCRISHHILIMQIRRLKIELDRYSLSIIIYEKDLWLHKKEWVLYYGCRHNLLRSFKLKSYA